MAGVCRAQQVRKAEAIAQFVADNVQDPGAGAKRSGSRSFRVTGHIGAELQRPDLSPNFAPRIIDSVNIQVGLTGQQKSQILWRQNDASRNRPIGTAWSIEWNEHSGSDCGVSRAV